MSNHETRDMNGGERHGPLDGDLQILVRDLVQKRLAYFRRWSLAFALLAAMLICISIVSLWLGARAQLYEVAERRFDQSTAAKMKDLEEELNRLRNTASQDAQTRQIELERLLREAELRLDETRKLLSDALAEVTDLRTSYSNAIAEARVRTSDAERWVHQAENSLELSATLAAEAQDQTRKSQEQAERLYHTFAAADAHLSAQDVATIVEELAKRDDFQLVLAEKLTTDPFRPLTIRGDIRIRGSLQISNPVDDGIRTEILPDGMKFAGNEGGQLQGRSIRISGGSHDQGVLRVMDRHMRDAVVITCDNTLSDAPNSGRIMLFADPKVTKYRAGIFLGSDKKYTFAVSDKDGAFQ